MNSQEDLAYVFFAAIILIAVLHGLVLAFIFLLNKKFNSKSNIYLALALLGICVILGYEVVYSLDAEDHIPIWIQYLPIYIRSTIPAGIFYFVVFLIQPEHRLTKFEKFGIVAIVLEVFLDLMYIPVNLILQEENSIAIAEYYIIIVGWFSSTITAIILLPWAFLRVNQYQRFLHNNYSTTSGKSLRWLQVFLSLTLITTGIWIISFIQFVLGYWEESDLTFGVVTLCFIILLFWTGYFVILRYHWFEIVPLNAINVDKEAVGSKLSAKTDIYHNNLKVLMEQEKLFKKIDLTLDNLSDRLQISSGYLSQIIKEKEQKNFFDFINTYRVEAVKEKLLDKDYQNYTILGVAMECGFNSKSTFNAVFKKFTGDTPSAYKKQHSIKDVHLS